MPEIEISIDRDTQGRFDVGHSPHPKCGRPKGLTNADKIRILLEPEREKLVSRLLELALHGDGAVSVRGLELALTRLAPTPKQESEKVKIPGFKDATTLQAKAEAVIQAIAIGDISTDAGEKLLRILDIYSRAITSTELESRLRILEDHDSFNYRGNL
jgi:hypothetical protein